MLRSQALKTPQLNLLWNLLRNPVKPNLALHQSLPHLLRNFLWNPVEPDLTPHRNQLSPEPSPEPCWTWLGSAPRLPGTFSGNFSRALLTLTWLCTKASQTLSGTFSGTLLNLTWPHQSLRSPEPSPEPCWTWPGSAPSLLLQEPSPEPCWTWPGCTKASRNLLRNLLRNPVEPDLALHQSLPEPSPGPSPEPCWTWRLCTKASQTFSGTFSGLNLTWLHQSLPDLRNLRNLFRNLVEPDPAPAPVHTGAILPLAYAVGGIRKNLA